MKIYSFHIDDISLMDRCEDFDKKCGSCNWDLLVFYWIADSKQEAEKEIKKMIKEGGAPLCADCMCEMLIDGQYKITKQ